MCEQSPGTPCPRCEVLPAAIVEPVELHCWFPAPHLAGKVRVLLGKVGVTAAISASGGFRFSLPDATREAAFEALKVGLSQVELDDTRALLTPPDTTLGAEHIALVEPLARLVTRSQSSWLLAMLEAERVTSHFQPIALASDPSVVYGHEALLRGVMPSGDLVSPGKLFDVARGAGVLFQLDLAARKSAIANAHAHQLQGALFVNFAPTAIYDPTSCLRTTVAAIDETGLDRRNVVFEIVETEDAHDTDHLRRILDYYRNAGFRIALDDIGSGYSSLNLIHLLRPDIIKLDMALVRGVDQDPYKARIAANLLDVARALNIVALAEGIETEGELAWVREHGATYVQGYLLGKPAAVPVHVTQFAA